MQLGAVSGVMRTERDGSALPAYERPQVDDSRQIGNWRRYSKLRTQLYPYVAAAAEEYQRTGMPIMRHLRIASGEGLSGDGDAARDELASFMSALDKNATRFEERRQTIKAKTAK